jgi:hypothetical protein
MGVSDLFFDGLRNVQFHRGAKVLGAAEVLEKLGHFGVAARFYDRVLDFFQSSAANPTYYGVLDARNRWQRNAINRGEDMELAYRTPIEQIAADPPRFV